MLVGGGTGRYNVCVTRSRDEEEEYLTLLNKDAAPNGYENVVTGGQLGMFPARTVVVLDYALKAAEAFFLDGSLTSELDWTSDVSPTACKKQGGGYSDRLYTPARIVVLWACLL